MGDFRSPESSSLKLKFSRRQLDGQARAQYKYYYDAGGRSLLNSTPIRGGVSISHFSTTCSNVTRNTLKKRDAYYYEIPKAHPPPLPHSRFLDPEKSDAWTGQAAE